MEAVAKLRNCPMSPRKMRLVVDLIRGKKVNEALNILKFTKKEASGWLEKLLLSAINNWEQKHGEGGADSANLFIKTAFVDGGMVIKRFQPAPHGRAHRIRKRRNHVTLIVASKEVAKTESNN
ncbi:MAG: 50S ribosomal protein L22 [Saprospiraceae bacterium]|nr:50S ribosomal protein L22 [Saprospiraceae bacterium]MBK8449322.1 50S ribosomal protein L22 [Saprospiraceae bacterium]MBK9222036.1 50S ribosomal protein L22 [Saprospiraceae bacterium]MBK9721054.1 50S ribosomal protein L22 [Saprospiraceae bacterium]MBK9728045.1 50S ribosomal protein L22 [Saprospiraceae bacterium]